MYGTNIKFRLLVVFLSFNHHQEVVILGVALLYDETGESFKCLFENFLNKDVNLCKNFQNVT